MLWYYCQNGEKQRYVCMFCMHKHIHKHTGKHIDVLIATVYVQQSLYNWLYNTVITCANGKTRLI